MICIVLFLTTTKFITIQGTYSLARAQQSFKSLVHIHEKNGNNILSLMSIVNTERYFNPTLYDPFYLLSSKTY